MRQRLRSEGFPRTALQRGGRRVPVMVQLTFDSQLQLDFSPILKARRVSNL